MRTRSTPVRVRPFFALLPALLLPVLLSGCGVLDIFSVDSLLRAPKLTGENARIQRSFEAAVGSDVYLINPLTGEYRSAFVFRDLDADGVEEALVFYARSETPNEVHMHCMDRQQDEWVSVGDVPGNGSEVYRVDFINADGDDRPEVVAEWTVADSKRNKTLAVYQYLRSPAEEDVSFTQLTVLQVYDYLALDFNADGLDELMYLFSDPGAQTQTVRACLIGMNPSLKTFAPLSEVELSRLAEFPLQCLTDEAGGLRRVYVDCLNFDGSYMTEILVFNPEDAALERPLDAEGAEYCLQTRRPDKILCTVVVGCVRVPVRYLYEDAEAYDSETGLTTDVYLTAVSVFGREGFRTVGGRYVYLPFGNCRLRVDSAAETYTVRILVAERQIRFMRREDPERVAFSIRFPENAGDDEKPYRIWISSAAQKEITEKSVERMIDHY